LRKKKASYGQDYRGNCFHGKYILTRFPPYTMALPSMKNKYDVPGIPFLLSPISCFFARALSFRILATRNWQHATVF
jgi:hypothetical protein